MSVSDGVVYMRDPPEGQGRWDTKETRAPTMHILGACAFALATIIYGTRIFTRISITKMNLRIDDYLCGVSVLSCWVFYITTTGMTISGGCGINFWQVTEETYEILLKWTLPVNIFYMLSTEIAKVSLLFFYLQLSPDQHFVIFTRIMITAFILYAVIYALMSIFGCSPLNAAWDLEAMATGKCINKEQFYLAASIANVCMDTVILLIPLRIVIPLQITLKQKVSLLLLFATGGFVIVVAALNCALTIHLFSSNNYTWGLAYELTWMYVELAGCVICASASTLKPFFTHFLPSLFGGSFASANKSHGNTMELSGTKGSRLQISRNQKDAFKLESNAGDSESLSKTDDDEAGLWSGAAFRRDENIQHSAHISTDDKTNGVSINTFSTWDQDDSHARSSRAQGGIAVVHTTEVSWSKST